MVVLCYNAKDLTWQNYQVLYPKLCIFPIDFKEIKNEIYEIFGCCICNHVGIGWL